MTYNPHGGPPPLRHTPQLHLTHLHATHKATQQQVLVLLCLHSCFPLSVWHSVWINRHTILSVHPDILQRLPDDVQRCDSNGPTALGTYFKRFWQESKNWICTAVVFLYLMHLDQAPHTPQYSPSL